MRKEKEGVLSFKLTSENIEQGTRHGGQGIWNIEVEGKVIMVIVPSHTEASRLKYVNC